MILSESMDMGIKNFQLGESLENILDISDYIMRKVAYDLFPELLSTEERAQIGPIGSHFTPDGSDAFDSTGIVNFYVGRYPIETVKKIVEYIKYILNEVDIKVGDVRYEKGDSGNFRVVRIPIVENGSGDSGNPPELNFSNANAHKIFGEILEMREPYSFDAADLLMKIDSARKRIIVRSDLSNTDQHSIEGNFYDVVKGKDYYLKQLDRVEEFARWAIERGYRSLYVE